MQSNTGEIPPCKNFHCVFVRTKRNDASMLDEFTKANPNFSYLEFLPIVVMPVNLINLTKLLKSAVYRTSLKEEIFPHKQINNT